MRNHLLRTTGALTVAFLFCVNATAQQVDDPMQPYQVDEHTVVLLHLDDNYVNESSQTADPETHGNLLHMSSETVDFLPQFGSVLYLDNDARSDSSFLSIPDADALDLEGSWTIEGWINILSIGVSLEDWHLNPKLFVKGAGGHCNYWVGPMGGTRNFRIGYERRGGGWDDCATASNSFELNTWYHVASIRDVDKGLLIMAIHDTSGALVAYSAVRLQEGEGGKPWTNEAPLRIGFCDPPWPDGSINGFIDEIRISNVVRQFPLPPAVRGILGDPVIHAAVGEAVEVQADIVTPTGAISSATLFYSTGGEFTEVPMAHSEGSIYTAVIPGQPEGTEVKYYITAENSFGYTASSQATMMGNFDGLYGITYGFDNQLVLHMDFEQSLYDSSALHQTVVDTFGTVEYSANAVSGSASLQLNGANSYLLKIDKPASYMSPEDMTIDMWINPDTIRDNYVILSKWQEYPFERHDWRFGYRLWWNWDMNLWFEFFTKDPNTQWLHVELPNMMEAGNWYHLIAKYSTSAGQAVLEVRDSSDVTIDEASLSAPGGLMPRAGEFIIGGDRYNWMWPFRFKGQIDNLKIYNYATNLPPVARRFDEPPVRHLRVNQDYTVSCDVENATSATAHYSLDGVNFLPAPMTPSGDMSFSIDVPGQDKGAVITYYIEASNDEGKTIRLPQIGYNKIAYSEEKDLTFSLDFEEGSGVPIDKSDYGSVVTVIGEPQYVEDAAEGNFALQLNDSSYITVENPAVFQIAEEQTIEISFKALDNLPADGTDLIAKYSDPPYTWRFGFRISFQADGRLFPEIHLIADDPADADWEWKALFLENDTRIEPNKWYRFVMESGDNYAYSKLYDADGVLLDQASMEISGQHLNLVDGLFSIGWRWDNAVPVFHGLIDDVKIYNYSKTEEGSSAVEEAGARNLIPTDYSLEQNFPNPFNPQTEIQFALPAGENVKIDIYNALGQNVKTLVSKKLDAGFHSVQWDGTNENGVQLPSGLYFYRIKAGSFVKVKKMMYLR